MTEHHHKVFNSNDYIPKRFGLNYSPPQIIIEYLAPSTGKLYHHKMRLHKFTKEKNTGEYYYFTRYGTKSYSDIDFSNKNKNYYLIFGKESTGIPKEILETNREKCYRIPTSGNIRALNLSNCVALVTYEALRQQNFPNLLFSDPFKGKDYLK